MTEVRQLFADVQPPGPTESNINTNFIEMARSIAAICATRMLLMVAVLTGAVIWIWATWQPTDERLYVACAFSLVFVLPQVALFWKRG
jgi:uncharacterized membrane protein YcjF (UPF0283 family)